MMSTTDNLTQTNAGSTPTASVGHPINTGPGDVSVQLYLLGENHSCIFNVIYAGQ